jgi:ATP-dependent DNA ligase
VVSRTSHHLGSHYPELVRAAERLLPEDTIVDGEMIAFAEDGLPDFWELQRRLGLAGARAEAEARRRPVHLVVFDLVRLEGADLLDEPLRDRRARLEALLPAAPGVQRTLHVADREVAERWLEALPPGTDGVVAKREDGPYRPGRRDWIKVRRERTADAVVLGIAGDPERPVLVLGLHGLDGDLHGFGTTRPLTAEQAEPLRPLLPFGRTSDQPVPSRWGGGHERWVELPEALVAEVSATHIDRGHLRGAARFERWRPDRDPRTCTPEQL